MTELDRLLPLYHYADRHAIAVDASPVRALLAVRGVTPADAPLLRALFRVRGLRTTRREPILAQMLAPETGFELLADAPDELVAGAVGRPWRWTERLRHDVDFPTFDEPGYAKMALGFRAGSGVLRTETRILLTDEPARRAFARYWRVVRPLSGLTRRRWLAAAKRLAESGYMSS
jgi:hypothetical protein